MSNKITAKQVLATPSAAKILIEEAYETVARKYGKTVDEIRMHADAGHEMVCKNLADLVRIGATSMAEAMNNVALENN